MRQLKWLKLLQKQTRKNSAYITVPNSTQNTASFPDQITQHFLH